MHRFCLAAIAVAHQFAIHHLALEQSGCTADPGLDLQGVEYTVEGAGAALHAVVPVGDMSFHGLDPEDFVRADDDAYSATGAFFLV